MNNTLATCKRPRRQGNLASHLVLPECLTVNERKKAKRIFAFLRYKDGRHHDKRHHGRHHDKRGEELAEEQKYSEIVD